MFLNYSTGRPRPLGHLTNFCTNFYEFFLISENSLKFANFFCSGNEFSIYNVFGRTLNLALSINLQKWRQVQLNAVDVRSVVVST